jgi:hypothetical protein
MKNKVWFKVLMTAATALCFVFSARAQEETKTRVLVPRTEQNDKGEFASLVEEVIEQGEEAQQPDYWLGVQIAALPEVVKRQLAVEHGLTVEEVSPDSPAAKAEIKKFDILVKADDKPLKEHSDLLKVVNDSQGKEIVLTIVRGGKDATVRVVAVKRPQTARIDVKTPRPEFRVEIKKLEEALENLKNKVGKDGTNLFFPKPAIVAPRVELKFDQKWTKEAVTDFPKDLKVKINKEGTKPAEIHVERGDKSWDVTEEKLGELPEDIRGHVEQMLGRKGPMNLFYTPGKALHVTPEGKVHGEIRISPTPPVPPLPPVPATAPRAPAAPALPIPPAAGARGFSFRTERSDDGGDSKLDAILKKLEKIESGTLDKLDKDVKQMRKELDELRKKSPSDQK